MQRPTVFYLAQPAPKICLTELEARSPSLTASNLLLAVLHYFNAQLGNQILSHQIPHSFVAKINRFNNVLFCSWLVPASTSNYAIGEPAITKSRSPASIQRM